MSNRILTAAWGVRGLSPTQNIILVRLADRANNEGKCYPGHESIAEDCCLSERTVRNTLPTIQTEGHLTIREEVQRTTKGKARFTYIVHPATPEAASAVTQASGATDTGKEALRQGKNATPTPEIGAASILTNSNHLNPNKNNLNIINAGLTNLKLTDSAIPRIASEIANDRYGWSYDNCKIQPAEIVSASLTTVLRAFVGKLSEKTIHECWQEAVTRAHGATIDGIAIKPAAYCVGCFRERLQNAVPHDSLAAATLPPSANLSSHG